MYFILLVNRVILSGGFVLGCFPISFLVLPSPHTLLLMVTFTERQIPSRESGLLSHGNTYPMGILGWLMNESNMNQINLLIWEAITVLQRLWLQCKVGNISSFQFEQPHPSTCLHLVLSTFSPLCSAGTELITARFLAWGPRGPCGLSTRGSPFRSVSGTQLRLLVL